MKKFWFSLAAAIFLVIAGAGGLIGFLALSFVTGPGSNEAGEVIYEITPQRSFMAVARDLETLGVVKNAQAFSIYARILDERARMKVGEYLLDRSMRPRQVLDIITSGRSIARPFTVSEGLNIFEIAELYEKSKFGTALDFLSLARDPAFVKSLIGEERPSLEGYLFPETYQITKFTQTRELLAAMVRQHKTIFNETVLPRLPEGWTPFEVLILASIIEKETGAPEDRPLVSSVFHNRIRLNMKLQTDPTIIYGIAVKTGVVPTNISRRDIETPTDYNTYTIPGLPPGPISNPGRQSLLAAVQPADTEYLFFVSRNDGTTLFTKTYEEHNRGVREFQLNPKAREGKSWRDLKAGEKAGSKATD